MMASATTRDAIRAQIEELLRRYYEAAPAQPPSDRVSLSSTAFDAREAIRALRTILDGWISQGPNVKAFEQAFARFIGRAAGVGMNSGSSANLLALLALKDIRGLREGDEVIVPAATFATVAMPVLQAGLVPVYVDVDRHTLNLDPEQVYAALSDRTRVVMPVHTLGYPAEMPRLMEIASQHRLAVLEDCCEAHGASLDGRLVGSFGDLATFSFFVAHNMTTGEGGMVVTDDPSLEAACRSMREFGRCDQQDLAARRFYSDDVLRDFDRRYVFDRLGYNVRMTDVAAAFGIEQLLKLEAMNRRRQENAARLKAHLREAAGDRLLLPPERPGAVHSYYAFSMVLTDRVSLSRRQFTERLEACGIETRPLFAGCLPDQPAFRRTPGRSVGSLPNARWLRDRSVFIGIHPSLEARHIDRAAEAIIAALRTTPASAGAIPSPARS